MFATTIPFPVAPFDQMNGAFANIKFHSTFGSFCWCLIFLSGFPSFSKFKSLVLEEIISKTSFLFAISSTSSKLI